MNTFFYDKLLNIKPENYILVADLNKSHLNYSVGIFLLDIRHTNQGRITNYNHNFSKLPSSRQLARYELLHFMGQPEGLGHY